MKNKILIISSIALCVLYSSCTERMDVEIDPSESRIVIEGSFTNELKIQSVTLAKSGDIKSSSSFIPVSNAFVYITNKLDTFRLYESNSKPGTYETLTPVAGKSEYVYILNIDNVDIDGNGQMESYSASEYMAPALPVDSIQLQYKEGGRSKYYEVRAYMYEPDTFGNVYLFNIFKNDTLLTDSLQEKAVQFDYAFNGKYLMGAPVGRLRDSDVQEKLKDGDSIIFEADYITEDFGIYISEMGAQSRGSNPLFGGPPSNVKGNILPAGMGLGYFSVYSVYKVGRVLKK